MRSERHHYTDRQAPRRPTEALSRYHRGELSEDQYLCECIERVTAHVRAQLSREHLEMIQELLTEMLKSDPILVEMGKRLLVTANNAEPRIR